MEINDEIRWGILGCGDVCEVKSGPAFSKVSGSRLVAVMRRDGAKAKDFALRHRVPKHYDDASKLIADPEINAIYIATPPAFHEVYAVEAMKAGKPVYIEKPVALNSESCERILNISRQTGVKACVAHYRRGLPLFKKIKSMLEAGVIGKTLLVLVNTIPPPSSRMQRPGYWRTDPAVSGGGLFFDLAPHQLDIFYWLFGKPVHVQGFSLNQRGRYNAPDLTVVDAVYGDSICLHGVWSFSASPDCKQEKCEIIGDKGKLSFSFFEKSEIVVKAKGAEERITLEYPENIQQPMIDEVVKFFRGQGGNPCSLEEALVTMKMMDHSNTRVDGQAF